MSNTLSSFAVWGKNGSNTHLVYTTYGITDINHMLREEDKDWIEMKRLQYAEEDRLFRLKMRIIYSLLVIGLAALYLT